MHRNRQKFDAGRHRCRRCGRRDVNMRGPGHNNSTGRPGLSRTRGTCTNTSNITGRHNVDNGSSDSTWFNGSNVAGRPTGGEGSTDSRIYGRDRDRGRYKSVMCNRTYDHNRGWGRCQLDRYNSIYGHNRGWGRCHIDQCNRG